MGKGKQSTTKRAYTQEVTERELRPRLHEVRYTSMDEEGELNDTDLPDEMQGCLCVSADPRRSGTDEGGENFILTAKELRLSLENSVSRRRSDSLANDSSGKIPNDLH